MSIIVLPRAETYRLVDLPDLLSKGNHPDWDVNDAARELCTRERQVWGDILRDAEFHHEFSPMIAPFSPKLAPGAALQERLLISQSALVKFLDRRGIAVAFNQVGSDRVLRSHPMRGEVHPVESIQETAAQRRERRYQMCIDAGLEMPRNPSARLPPGVGTLAKREGVQRQSFAQDVKAHIGWLYDKDRQAIGR